MNPIHGNFSILKDTQKVINKKIVFISELTPDRSKWYKWVPTKILKQICFQTCTSLDMTNILLKSRKAEAIFIFEHKPQYSLLLYLTCILKKVPVFFIVHGIQQAQKKSIFHFLGGEVLRMLVHRFRFWPIHLEISDKGLHGIQPFSKSIVIPHPVSNELTFNSKKENKRLVTSIGIVGMLRNDKPILPLIKLLQEYVKRHANVEFYIGTPFWQELPCELTDSGINLVDTSSKEQYFSFLNTLDIVITDFEKESFYFRPSGIINDSISCGCFVIAPNYPVFKAQLHHPIKVGETYESLENLDAVITNAINYIKLNHINFDRWIEARLNSNIVDTLGRRMVEIIDSTHSSVPKIRHNPKKTKRPASIQKLNTLQ